MRVQQLFGLGWTHFPELGVLRCGIIPLRLLIPRFFSALLSVRLILLVLACFLLLSRFRLGLVLLILLLLLILFLLILLLVRRIILLIFLLILTRLIVLLLFLIFLLVLLVLIFRVVVVILVFIVLLVVVFMFVQRKLLQLFFEQHAIKLRVFILWIQLERGIVVLNRLLPHGGPLLGIGIGLSHAKLGVA